MGTGELFSHREECKCGGRAIDALSIVAEALAAAVFCVSLGGLVVC